MTLAWGFMGAVLINSLTELYVLSTSVFTSISYRKCHYSVGLWFHIDLIGDARGSFALAGIPALLRLLSESKAIIWAGRNKAR